MVKKTLKRRKKRLSKRLSKRISKRLSKRRNKTKKRYSKKRTKINRKSKRTKRQVGGLRVYCTMCYALYGTATCINVDKLPKSCPKCGANESHWKQIRTGQDWESYCMK